jgi:hypothetical protein
MTRSPGNRRNPSWGSDERRGPPLTRLGLLLCVGCWIPLIIGAVAIARCGDDPAGTAPMGVLQPGESRAIVEFEVER